MTLLSGVTSERDQSQESSDWSKNSVKKVLQLANTGKISAGKSKFPMKIDLDQLKKSSNFVVM